MTPYTTSVGDPTNPLMLCLHGIGSCADAFEPQAPLAERCDRHVMAWDAPGYRNSANPDHPFTLDDWADAAAKIIRANGGSADLLGVSWGGVTATRVALRHPELIRSLILADTTIGSGWSEEGAAAMRSRYEGLVSMGVNEFATSRAPRLLSDGAPQQLVDRAAEMMVASVRMPVYQWACAALADANHGPDLHRITVPTLVVVGAKDHITPIERSEVLATGITGARLTKIPNAGHLANQEQPAAFNDAVAAFLTDLEQS